MYVIATCIPHYLYTITRYGIERGRYEINIHNSIKSKFVSIKELAKGVRAAKMSTDSL